MVVWCRGFHTLKINIYSWSVLLRLVLRFAVISRYCHKVYVRNILPETTTSYLIRLFLLILLPKSNQRTPWWGRGRAVAATATVWGSVNSSNLVRFAIRALGLPRQPRVNAFLVEDVTALSELTDYHIFGEGVQADGAALVFEDAFLLVVKGYGWQSSDLVLRHTTLSDSSID